MDNVNELTSAQLVTHYLMNSYLYYIKGLSCITDTEYDRLCQRLLTEWDDVTHVHKEYVDKEALEAGTAYHLKEDDYPTIARFAAMAYYNANNKDN